MSGPSSRVGKKKTHETREVEIVKRRRKKKGPIRMFFCFWLSEGANDFCLGLQLVRFIKVVISRAFRDKVVERESGSSKPCDRSSELSSSTTQGTILGLEFFISLICVFILKYLVFCLFAL